VFAVGVATGAASAPAEWKALRHAHEARQSGQQIPDWFDCVVSMRMTAICKRSVLILLFCGPWGEGAKPLERQALEGGSFNYVA